VRGILAALLLAVAAVPAGAADVSVTLDPRVETLGIVQLLAGGEPPQGFRAPEGEYARRVKAAFAAYKNHPAVALTAALPRAFDFRNRTDAIIRRGGLPELAPRWFIPQYMVLQAGGREKFEAWIAALADFAREARVAEFVRDNESALEPALSEFRGDVARRGYIPKLERYAGYPLDGTYSVIVAPFILRGSQENSVIRLEDGRYAIVSVVGPDYQSGRLSFRPEDFVATAGHELSHGLIDTLGDLHRERILRSSGVYGRLPWPCYNDWLQCAKENYVRAIMLRLVDSELGPEAERRHLEQEGRAKWPYLEKTTELLKEYEAHRDRWPDLASFYPTLLTVFPEDPPAASSAPALGADAGPGPEWVFEETRPFSTAGQRGLALEYLDRALKAAADPRLLRRRAAFRLLQGDAAGAEADAGAAVALAPGEPTALLARGLARARLGRPVEAGADFAAAFAACGAAPAEDALACANARRLAQGGAVPAGLDASVGPDPNIGPNPELGPGPGPGPDAGTPRVEPSGPGRPSTVDYEFVVDPRIELLAAAVALARPGGAPAPAGFAGLKDHPAVKRLKAALARGVNEIVPSQLLLTVGPPPGLKEAGPVASGLAEPFGGEAEAEAFLAELRDFAAAGGWDKEWASRQSANAELVARAVAETRRTLSPEAVESWFGVRFKSRYVFVISADLPSAFACNSGYTENGRRVEVRLRSVMGWRDKNAYFSFDDFAGSVAHELTHTITDPILLARQAELAAFSSLMVPGCTDSWTGCVLEQVNIAATLRALRQESGEAAEKATLAHYAARGFPLLPALVDRFAEFEDPAVKARGFAAFYPRVADVFRSSLRDKFRVQARANVAALDAASAAAPEPFSEEFSVDPRLELVSVLHRLAAPADERARAAGAAPEYAAAVDARFLAFSTHPAVALTARLDAAAGARGLPASLIVHFSTSPELSQRVSVPGGYRAAAGGDAALDAWVDSLRGFARDSRFFDFVAQERGAYEGFEREARAEAARAPSAQAVAAYLGVPLRGRRAYALSPLYPDSYPRRLAVFLQGGSQILRARAALPGRGGAPVFGLDSDDGSSAQEIAYDEAARLVPGAATAAARLSDDCSDRAGAGWPTCVREHLVAAVLLRARGSGRAGSGALPYLPALLETLKVYEGARASYPALADFWPEAQKAFGGAPRAAAASAEELAEYADVRVDPRVELVSVLLRLGGVGRGAGTPNEAQRLVDEKFAAFASHPAVARVASLSRGSTATPLRLALALGDLPGLAERGTPPEPWLGDAGGPEGFKAFAADLRAFVKDAHFGAYYDAARPLDRGYEDEARAEALRGGSPRAAQAYLGIRPPQTRFLVTALLPDSDGADFVLSEDAAPVRALLRPASGAPGPARFGLDEFAGSALHELIRGATDPLVPERFDPGGSVPAGCGGENAETTWRGCARKHLVSAVALRLLARDLGEDAARARLAAYAERGFPLLPRLVELLRGYESERGKYPTLAAFAPRLLAAFAPSPRAAEASAEELAEYADVRVDPRVELVSVLLRLGGVGRGAGTPNEAQRLADEKFAAFASHPAVARVASLSRGSTATPLRLALALGDLPGLAERGTPPEPWLGDAGGPEGFKAFAADLRAFVKDAHFGAYYDAARPLDRGYEDEARAEALRGGSPRAAQAYLGVRPPRVRFLLSALLPESYGTDFVLGEGTASVRALIWPAAEAPGPTRFRLDAFGDSAVHELVHGVTDPLVPERFDPGGAVPRGCNDENVEANWRGCAQEHLVYAVTLRLLARELGEDAARAWAATYAERGFPRLPRLVELLRAYESNRDKYPTLAAFAPRLLAAFGGAVSEVDAARAARAQALMGKGVDAFLAGRLSEATALLRRARTLAPEDPEISLNLGVCLDKGGDAAGAEAAYTRAVETGLSGAQRRWEIAAAALSSRADLRARQARRALARADLAKALGLVPADWPGRPDLQKRLEALGR
jgi:Flp pilus assembly protein TadD